MKLDKFVDFVNGLDKDELVQEVHKLLCKNWADVDGLVLPVYLEDGEKYSNMVVRDYLSDSKELCGCVDGQDSPYFSLYSFSTFDLLRLYTQYKK